MDSLRLLLSKRIGIHFSCPYYDQIKISPIRFCSCFEVGGFLKTLAKCGAGGEGFIVFVLSSP